MTPEALGQQLPELQTTLGEALLAPTRIYVKALNGIKNAGVAIRGCSHITGGGFYENVPRMLPARAHAVIEKNSYEMPPLFSLIAKTGGIAWEEMYNTFNCGIGMVLCVKEEDADRTVAAAEEAGERAFVIGRIEEGDKGVTLC